MRAATVNQLGATPVVGTRPDPIPTPGQALVEVHAAALNPIDLLIGAGRHPVGKPAMPYVPGVEGAGVVLASETLPVGSRVRFAALGGLVDGSVAQRATVPDEACVPLPDALDFETAAAIGTVGISALVALERYGRVEHGSSVLVLSGGSPFGLALVHAARSLGASRLIAAGRSAQHLEQAASIGCDTIVLDPDNPGRLASDIAALGAPPDVVADPLWGPYASVALSCLASGGRFVNVGQAAGAETPLAAGLLRHGNRTISGFSGTSLAPRDAAAAYRRVAELALTGLFTIPIERYALDDVAVAWERQSSSPGAKQVLAL